MLMHGLAKRPDDTYLYGSDGRQPGADPA
ncbi:hypothetical protein SPHINGO8AM_30468 [Sphingomonas sp. 8AM]|nr:hypothetical protein SPHINGO8AM_30468 [Sphingomonas sp. 8AM]